MIPRHSRPRRSRTYRSKLGRLSLKTRGCTSNVTCFSAISFSSARKRPAVLGAIQTVRPRFTSQAPQARNRTGRMIRHIEMPAARNAMASLSDDIRPNYEDVVRNAYVMPWAYLHGTNDYFAMAELSAEFPGIHQSFNLVPSLLLKPEEYAGGEANDPLLVLAFKPVEALTGADRALI